MIFENYVTDERSGNKGKDGDYEIQRIIITKHVRYESLLTPM